MSEPAPATSRPSPLHAVARVRELLDALGDALVAWRLGRVQALHAELADAVAALQLDNLPPLDPSTKRLLAGELANTANALVRCRRLGASIAELARLHARAMGETESYNAVGETTVSGVIPLLRTRA